MMFFNSMQTTVHPQQQELISVMVWINFSLLMDNDNDNLGLDVNLELSTSLGKAELPWSFVKIMKWDCVPKKGSSFAHKHAMTDNSMVMMAVTHGWIAFLIQTFIWSCVVHLGCWSLPP